MSILATALISIIQNGPALINEAITIYGEIKASLSATDQAAIDAALVQAQASDADSTNKADAALDAASKM